MKRAQVFLLTVVTAAAMSGCAYYRNSNAGKRPYPYPASTVVDLREAPTPARLPGRTPPLSVCRPEFEAPGPVAIVQRKPFLLENPAAAEEVVFRSLVAELQASGIDASGLDHSCNYFFQKNGDTDLFLKTAITRWEENGSYVGVGLEVTLFRQGGRPLFSGLYAGSAATGSRSPADALPVAMRKLLDDLLSSSLAAVLNGNG